MGSMFEVMQKLREDGSVEEPVQEPVAEQAETTPAGDTPVPQGAEELSVQAESVDTPVAQDLEPTDTQTEPADTPVAQDLEATDTQTEPADTPVAQDLEATDTETEPADTPVAEDEGPTVAAFEPIDNAAAAETSALQNEETLDTQPEMSDASPVAEAPVPEIDEPATAESELTDDAVLPDEEPAAGPAEPAETLPTAEAPAPQVEEPVAESAPAEAAVMQEEAAVADQPAPVSHFEPAREIDAPGKPGPVPGYNLQWDPKQIDPAVVAFHERYSSVTEQFRSVRARLLSMNGSSTHRMIAITSSVPQEGKSVSAVNLGFVMAEGGEHRILVADADFRRSSIGRMLGLAARPGLAELIRGEHPADVLLCSTPMPNLYVLPPGKMAPQSASELLGSPSTREVLTHLRESFDYVLLDLPPVNTVSDVSMLAPNCDGVILVVEMHRTPEPTAQQAVRTLQANNARILGCILTRHDDRRTHYYDRYYGYYYRDA